MEEANLGNGTYYGRLFNCQHIDCCTFFSFVVPFFKENLPHFWASLLGAVFIILCIAPFLRAIMVKKNHSVEFMTLWHDNRANRAPLLSTIVIRIMIAVLLSSLLFPDYLRRLSA